MEISYTSRKGTVVSVRSENKGADQLCSYCTADLRLCFRICRNPVFSLCGSNDFSQYYSLTWLVWVCCGPFISG